MTGSRVMTHFFYKGLTRNPEIGKAEFLPKSGDRGKLRIPIFAQISLMKKY